MLKVAQQRVLSLVRAQNKSVRNNPKILTFVKSAFQDDDELLTMATDAIARQGDLLELLANDSSWWETVKQATAWTSTSLVDFTHLLVLYKEYIRTDSWVTH